MPSVYGILETALYVTDLHRSAQFYRRLFNFDTLLDTDRLIALDVAGRNVLLLFKEGATSQPFATPGGVIPGHAGAGPTHFAFSISAEEVPLWTEQLEAAGIAVESIVRWPTGAQSIYFRDPDQHLVELITAGFWRIYSDAHGAVRTTTTTEVEAAGAPERLAMESGEQLEGLLLSRLNGSSVAMDADDFRRLHEKLTARLDGEPRRPL